MTAPVAAAEFLELLKKSRLLTYEQYYSAIKRLSLRDAPSTADIAARLKADGLITPFQADRLLQGNIRGLVLDEYKLLEVLGAGGMGWVYVAEEIKTKWRVAIKVLPDHCRNDRGVLARFRLEAEAGKRLAHPNILKTFSIQRTTDIYGEINYVVMELVKGISLLELIILKKRLDWRQACDIVVQTANGLQHAHDRGLIHRDIKPENILVCHDGTVKILDFGLAMIDENDEEFSMAMIFGQDRLGTADYVSPEQAIDSYNVDARTDIYSLGCTFYLMLTGRLPFPFKTTAEKLKAHRQMRPKPVEEIRTDVPDRVLKILQKMISKHKENRFSSAQDLIRYVKPYAERKQIEFEFADILASRVDQAQKRQERKLQEKLATGSSNSALERQTPIPPRPRQSTIQTILGDDTRIDKGSPPDSGSKNGTSQE